MYPIMTTLGVWQRPKCGFLQGPKQFIITTVKTLNCDFPYDIFYVINIHRQLVGDIGNIEIGNIGWCIDVSYISVHLYYRALFLEWTIHMDFCHILAIYWLSVISFPSSGGVEHFCLRPPPFSARSRLFVHHKYLRLLSTARPGSQTFKINK